MGDQHVVETRAPRKARQILNSLLENRIVTPSGVKWLEVATDPFHDTEIRPDGYPDMVSTRSITQTVTKTITVNAPSGVTTNWDMHVFFAPLSPTFTQSDSIPSDPTVDDRFYTTDVVSVGKVGEKLVKLPKTDHDNPLKKKLPCRKPPEPSTSEEDQDGDSTPSVYQGYYLNTVDRLGHLQYATGHTPVQSGWNAIGILGNENWTTSFGENHTGIQLPAEYTSGAWRLIATGLEVTNTTASLYKGGSVTCYRSPSPSGIGEYFVQKDDLAPRVDVAGKTCVMPPETQSDAALYPNSKTWGAEDGIYLIPTMNSTDNPYFSPKPGTAGMVTPSSYNDLLVGNGWIGYFPFITDGVNSVYPNSSLTTTLPWDISGAVFSGLNTNSAMQVTVRYYIERNPTIADPNLLVLARTPCPYDPIVQEIYTRCMEELPVGVKVGMNPLGEWFTEVLQGIGEWAPKIGKAIGNIIPGAGIIGNIVGTAASGIQMARGTKITEKVDRRGREQITVAKPRKAPPQRRKVQGPTRRTLELERNRVARAMGAANPSRAARGRKRKRY